MPFNLLFPVFWSFMERINRRGVLYVDTQQCNFLDYKQCIRTLQLYFLASESAIRYRLVNIGWMRFNIHFEPTVDRGISIAEYLQHLHNRKKRFPLFIGWRESFTLCNQKTNHTVVHMDLNHNSSSLKYLEILHIIHFLS